jgi:hypothetical protein
MRFMGAQTNPSAGEARHRPQPLRELVAVHAGHADVEQRDLGHELLDPRKRFVAGVGDARRVQFQEQGETGCDVAIVVDDQDPMRARHEWPARRTRVRRRRFLRRSLQFGLARPEPCSIVVTSSARLRSQAERPTAVSQRPPTRQNRVVRHGQTGPWPHHASVDCQRIIRPDA